MAIPKILLYYVFTPLSDPEAIRLWQRDLCESLGLRGRILISKDGLNGTVGGDLPALKRYVRKTRQYAPFAEIDFKWSEGTGLDESGASLDFPRLVVKVRDEIVSFGSPEALTVDAGGVVGGGTRLAPAELHALVAERGDDVVFFDGRNAFEAEIGRFRGAVVPDVANTREFAAELDSGKYDHLKGQPVVTYCTGGIRCEVLSSLMKDRGFGEVYQLEGGIVRYGEAYGDDGLWDGSLYVFDQRMSVDFSGHATVLGHCQVCGAGTKNMLNCRDLSCREQLVACPDCVAVAAPACAAHAA
ncbi:MULTISPECIES: rhodanese-related sulfurtransferase [unclassified Cryobacterium]|uniref:oxygen-dependent tRNA uridine(34) hydroxylase TrhO n=1 Tax=unclassified Cryobacterium TaxID=2649013 RepID=UPI00106ABA19|nr:MULTISPECIES: rhodanese-related sulfurtransferase [unclassified Cryobacterium]TFC50517.1 rhodanese-related sulfurtransferase [Cryobacterium sp. TMB3-1-2]TFC58387.1 rhodanese-related sulfurtransferase [Cryobacterium sp. TMB1-7]TFC74131.1 rhodanese-related sulfurtransferase [Cryobacterium sp. TMB3-10]TFC74735.1 rhodanese-related sulfurtransferase [Cryobacterium sp. TMB3-15]TFC91299.1 rhodanese-related sulfurtransferase [Cryobacterium sp. TMT4-31]